LAQRLCRFPGLLVADVGVADRRAYVFVAQQLLDFAQVLSHVVEEDCGHGMPQPVSGDLPHPERSASGSEPKVERPVGEWRRCRETRPPSSLRLGTDIRENAERIVADLNAVLANQDLWKPGAREFAARTLNLNPVALVECFYDGIQTRPVESWTRRNEILPLPTAEDGYSLVLLTGSVGAGKTTLVRQLIGTDPETERFPSTSKSWLRRPGTGTSWKTLPLPLIRRATR
jgi:hypothetical protein